MTVEEIDREIGFEAAKYAKADDEGVSGINATKFNAVVHGATFGYQLAAAENEELRKELERVKGLVKTNWDKRISFKYPYETDQEKINNWWEKYKQSNNL